MLGQFVSETYNMDAVAVKNFTSATRQGVQHNT